MPVLTWHTAGQFLRYEWAKIDWGLTPSPMELSGTYLLRVPPTMRTAREAVAWTFGLQDGDYEPDVES